jgi:hypothetical protein
MYNKDLHNFHPLPNTIKMIKSRKMRWVGFVESMGENKMITVL